LAALARTTFESEIQKVRIASAGADDDGAAIIICVFLMLKIRNVQQPVYLYGTTPDARIL
jgi:hypothetical protein